MEIRLLKTAQYELDDSFIYYEDQVRGLGTEFLDEILDTLKELNQIRRHGNLFLNVHAGAWSTGFRTELFIRSGKMNYSLLQLPICTENLSTGRIELNHDGQSYFKKLPPDTREIPRLHYGSRPFTFVLLGMTGADAGKGGYQNLSP